MDKSKFIKLIFFAGLFLFFLLPATDPDLGWHLRCGEEIWTKHTPCNVNTFSVLLENYKWPNHFWLYQAVLFPIYKSAGLWGLGFFNAAVVGLAFFFFYQAIAGFAWEKMLAVFTIISFGWGVFSFGIRGQLMGFLFFNILLWLLTQIKKKPKLAFFIPLTTLIWANTHGSVILGLILLFFFCAKQVYEEPKKLIRSVIIFVSSVIITLCNPFGFKIYQESWQHVFGQIDLSKLIAEWVPPNPNVYWTILISGSVFLLYLLIAASPKEIIFAALILPFAFLGVGARRHVHFYFLILFYLFFALPTSRKLLDTWRKQKVLREYLAVFTAFLFLGVSLFLRLPRTYMTNRTWENYCQASPVTVPCEAVEFLKKESARSLPAKRRGNIFNRYEWGGFLIWQLPSQKIFVDGRMPAWPSFAPTSVGATEGKLAEEVVSPYTIYLETLQTQPGWEKILEEYNIDFLLISPGTFMDLLLQPNPKDYGWQEVYRDQISVIYKRKI